MEIIRLKHLEKSQQNKFPHLNLAANSDESGPITSTETETSSHGSFHEESATSLQEVESLLTGNSDESDVTSSTETGG